MAKLNVVIPSVDVEVIGEGGVKTRYRKVDRSAEKGDILKITDNEGDDSVIEGAFYEVTRLDFVCDPQFIDEEGNETDGHDVEYEVYEKVTETAQPTIKYREVVRKAKVGERIRVIGKHRVSEVFNVGDELTVSFVDAVGDIGATEEAPIFGYIFFSGGHGREYVVLEPVEETQPVDAPPKRLTVGDYAKVIVDDAEEYRIGEIIRITKDDHDSVPYKGEYADGMAPDSYLYESDVEPATEAEFLAQKEPAPFKRGEYVKVTDESGNVDAKFGDIGEIYEVVPNWDTDGGELLRVKTLDGREYGMFAKRFVRATESEVESAKQTLKYGDFADGDYAEIVNATRVNASDTVVNRAGEFGTVTRQPGGYRSLKITFAYGDFGFCNPDALRKVTREEYEAAIDPRSQFAKGDKVRLVSGGQDYGLFGFTNGNIYEVSNPRPAQWENKRVQIVDSEGFRGYAKPEQLVKVNAEEIAEIERKKAEEEARRREESKWSAIGRKVGEFKVGDIIEITRYQCGAKEGSRVEVKNVYGSSSVSYDGGYGADLNAIKLVVPVEQRFDKAA